MDVTQIEEALGRLEDGLSEARMAVQLLREGDVTAATELDVLAGESRGPAEVRAQLETIGFGLMAPLFFVTAGLHFDLGALVASSAGLALVPLMLVAMIATRALPALFFARVLERRELLACGLLMSVKLTFVVAAVQIGSEAGALEPAAASAIVSAALISVVTLPTLVRWLLRRAPGAVAQERSAPAPA